MNKYLENCSLISFMLEKIQPIKIFWISSNQQEGDGWKQVHVYYLPRISQHLSKNLLSACDISCMDF